jgi:hypothetical protein
MNYKTISKGLKIAICINCILLFIAPLSYSFGPLDMQDMGSEFGWKPDYFYKDESTLILIAPLYLLWLGYLVHKKRIVKQLLIIFLIGLSAFYSFFGFMSISMPMQDYQPYWGTLILFLFFPMLVVFFFFEWKVSKMKETYLYADTILDEKIA